MQKEELKKKLKLARQSWQYVWELISRMLEKDISFELKQLLFQYQVELDSNFKKMDYIEEKLGDEDLILSEEETYSIDQLLSWISTDHQAKTIFIDNILKR